MLSQSRRLKRPFDSSGLPIKLRERERRPAQAERALCLKSDWPSPRRDEGFDLSVISVRSRNRPTARSTKKGGHNKPTGSQPVFGMILEPWK